MGKAQARLPHPEAVPGFYVLIDFAGKREIVAEVRES